MKKSEAISKFEMVMNKAFSGALIRSTVETLKEVEKPIFNTLNSGEIDQLSRYYQNFNVTDQEESSASNRNSISTGGSKKLTFTLNFSERINQNMA